MRLGLLACALIWITPNPALAGNCGPMAAHIDVYAGPLPDITIDRVSWHTRNFDLQGPALGGVNWGLSEL